LISEIDIQNVKNISIQLSIINRDLFKIFLILDP